MNDFPPINETINDEIRILSDKNASTDLCRFITRPVWALATEYQLWQDIAKASGKKLLVLCDRSYKGIASIHTAYNDIISTSNGWKPDVVIIHTGWEPEINGFEPGEPITHPDKTHLEKMRIRVSRQQAIFLDLYNSIQCPKLVLTVNPVYNSIPDPHYDMQLFETFYIRVFTRQRQLPAATHKKFKLSCLNRMARPTRIDLFSRLLVEPFFKDMHCSFHAIGLLRGNDGRLTRQLPGRGQSKYAYLGQIAEWVGEARSELITKTLSSHWDMFPINPDGYNLSDHNWNIGFDPKNYAYTGSLCNIATETDNGIDQVFLTEKTFTCLAHGMPFFVQTGHGAIAHLRDIGFDVWDDVIDHAYDAEPDYATRQDMLMDSIRKYMATEFVRDIDRENRNIAHFYSPATYKIFFDSLVDRLTNM
jgi:hypothetical protein